MWHNFVMMSSIMWWHHFLFDTNIKMEASRDNLRFYISTRLMLGDELEDVIEELFLIYPSFQLVSYIYLFININWE